MESAGADLIILETAALLTSRAGSRGFTVFVIVQLKNCPWLYTGNPDDVTEQSFGIMSLGYIETSYLKKMGLCPSLPITPGQSGLLEGEHARSEFCSYLSLLSILSGSSISGDLFYATQDAHLLSTYNWLKDTAGPGAASLGIAETRF